MENDPDHEALNLSLAPPNSDYTAAAAETPPPLVQYLPVVAAPSSSSTSSFAGSDVSSQGLAPNDGFDLLSGSSNSSTAALRLGGPSSSTDGLDLSLGLAAESPSLGEDISLGRQPISSGGDSPAITSGSKVASSNQYLAKPRRIPSVILPMTKITIGDWTKAAVNRYDLIVRCFFGRQKFIWEILDVVGETETRQHWKRMAINWGDVLSLKADVQTGCLEIELGVPPTFFQEGGLGCRGKWEKISHYTPDHPSTFCRRHALYFDPEVLETNFKKIVADSFWARGTLQVPFPSLPNSLHFGDGHANLAVGDNSQNATTNQLLAPQVIPPSQQMNGPNLGGTSQQSPKRRRMATRSISKGDNE